MTPFISAGSIQLLVAPASASSREQMNVRSSTRATSEGSDAHQKELGFFASSRRISVPAPTRPSVSRPHSSWDPSHQTTRSGWVSSATSCTQSLSPRWMVGEPIAGAVMGGGSPS